MMTSGVRWLPGGRSTPSGRTMSPTRTIHHVRPAAAARAHAMMETRLNESWRGCSVPFACRRSRTLTLYRAFTRSATSASTSGPDSLPSCAAHYASFPFSGGVFCATTPSQRLSGRSRAREIRADVCVALCWAVLYRPLGWPSHHFKSSSKPSQVRLKLRLHVSAPPLDDKVYALMTAMASRTTRSTHSCCTKGRSSSAKHAVTLTRANRGLPSVRALT